MGAVTCGYAAPTFMPIGSVMEKAMQEFNSGDLKIRAAEHEDGKIWMVGKDVADALGYPDVSDAFRAVPEKYLKLEWTQTAGGRQKALMINEYGFYTLAIRSNKPGAGRFREWVAEEVLPTIRRTGAYISKPLTRVELAENILRAERHLEHQQKINEAITPSAAGWDNLVKPNTLNGDWSVKYCAQKLRGAGIDVSHTELNTYLMQNGFTVFDSNSGRFEPSPHSFRAGLITGNIDEVTGDYIIRITPKGLSIIYVALGGHPDIPSELLALEA
jgi:anti-repressor protein